MKLAFNTWVYSSFPVWVPAYPLEEVVAYEMKNLRGIPNTPNTQQRP